VIDLTIGDEIRTTLTPMTFSKPGFNGIQWDFSADKYEGTLLLARPSRPTFASAQDIPEVKTSATNLLGGRGVIQVGDFVKLGGTYVTAYQGQTLLDDFTGNPFAGGALTTDQNALPVSRIVIRLSDDSPEDGLGGAALFDDEIAAALAEDLALLTALATASAAANAAAFASAMALAWASAMANASAHASA